MDYETQAEMEQQNNESVAFFALPRPQLFRPLWLVLVVLSCFTPSTHAALTLDVDNLIHAGVDKKLGIGLTRHRDVKTSQSVAAFNSLGVNSFRYEPGIYNPAMPNGNNSPLVGFEDPAVWYVPILTTAGAGGYSPPNRYYTQLPHAEYASLLSETNTHGYYTVEIDPLLYTGSGPSISESQLISNLQTLVQRNKDEGWNITHWEIGNESDLTNALFDGGVGDRWTPQTYADIARTLTLAIKAIDPTAKVGVNGGFQPTNDFSWWQPVLTNVADVIDFAVVHEYSFVTNSSQWENANRNYPLLGGKVDQLEQAIAMYAPGTSISVTEFGSLNPSQSLEKISGWRAALNVQYIMDLLTHDSIEDLHFWTSRWTNETDLLYNAFDPNYNLTAIGESVQLWTDYQQEDMLDWDRENAVRAYALGGESTDELVLFLINGDNSSVPVQVDLPNFDGDGTYTLQSFRGAGNNPNSQNVELVAGSGTFTPGAIPRFSATLDPFSVAVVVLQEATTMPGDFNGDGYVDGADFLIWQRGGSPNGITSTDLTDWQDNYGGLPPLSDLNGLQTVPEATGIALALSAVLLGSTRRRPASLNV